MGILTDFGRLTNFRGREPRREFWPYFAVVAVVYVFGSQLIAIPFMANAMVGMVAATADPKFQAATQASDPFSMMQAMNSPMHWLQVASVVEWVIVLGLLAAAVCRRLRDAGLSPYWALTPLPAAIIGVLATPFALGAMGGSGGPNMTLFAALSMLSVFNMVATLTLIILLCQPTAPEGVRSAIFATFGDILANFKRLATFTGAEPRRRFWPYTAIVLVIYMVTSSLLMIPVMGGIFTAATKSTADGANPAAIVPFFQIFFAGIAFEAVLQVILLAAAVARRLRDGGLPARWGLLPLPFLVLAMIGFPVMFEGFTAGHSPSMLLFFGLFLNNLSYIGCLIALIVLLCRSTRTPANPPLTS